MKKLLPLILILLGIGGGVGAGLALRPEPAEDMAAQNCAPAGEAKSAKPAGSQDETAQEASTQEYVKLNNQFVIPVVAGSAVESLVVMSLSIEVTPGSTETVYRHEPKLRDQFLEVLFAHANMGGFRGSFTDANNLDVLRRALLDSARAVLGDTVTGILITDLGRRDE